MSARLALGLVASSLLVSCGGSTASPEPVPPRITATATSQPTTPPPSPTPMPLPAGAVRFTTVGERSTATIRVREQIADRPLPGDAVVRTNAFAGDLVLLADGSFAPGSVLSVDLDTLKSDSDLRDEWIKINTLQTRRYPRAEFVASRVSGVPLPLPPSGEWNAKVDGTMRIHGTDKPLTWDLIITRAPGEVRARGTTVFRFGDYGMAVPANRLILSVVDEVRLEIDVVAQDAPR